MLIVHEDDNKIIVNKDAGQLTQSGKNFDLDLVSELLNYRKMKKEDMYVAVINRLDRPVSGLVLFAKNKEYAAKYSQIMQEKGFSKRYFAVICGKLCEKQGIFVDYITKTNDNMALIVEKSTNNVKKAELKYKIVEEKQIDGVDISFVEIELITGRFHQIRAQFSHRGHGIIGDTKYNDVNACDGEMRSVARSLGLKPREIALCAHELTVENETYNVVPDWWKY